MIKQSLCYSFFSTWAREY